ncbi:unnamed protein product [Rotaria magnacalcarata]|uniref:EF-hand domain-containing protein n=1 Tax=Rotaria magnacalcarata TaxID=392030 RepID=A0A819YMK5_9BILA|nr:unnamed protein product [Rotaria magnacalcarata]
MANITEEQLQKEFRRLDKDDSKFITVDELRQYYLPMQEMLGISNALAEQEILGFMKRFDDDGNRKISFEGTKQTKFSQLIV